MKCSGEYYMDRAGDIPVECCGSPAAGIEAHAEACPLECHDDCDAPTCACDWSGDCECPCDECQSARAAALARDDHEAYLADWPEMEWGDDA